MLSVIGFLLVLAPLVVFHEFGHFIFAKIFGVKAEIFSIGFGPRLFSRQIGETEFRISPIPLGGYVKLLGEDGESELDPILKTRTLNAQAKWKRFLIYLGGPLFNFLLAACIYALMQLIGEPVATSRISRVLVNSPAYIAGLRSGDKILSMAGKSVVTLEQFYELIQESPSLEMPIQIERQNKDAQSASQLELSIPIEEEEGISVFGEEKNLGVLKGVVPVARGKMFRFVPASLPADKIKELGDSISNRFQLISWNEQPLESFEYFESIGTESNIFTPGSLKVQEVESGRVVVFSLLNENDFKKIRSGIRHIELELSAVSEGSPAGVAGLKPRDLLLSINGDELFDFEELRGKVASAGVSNSPINVAVLRGNKVEAFDVTPTARMESDALLRKKMIYSIGIAGGNDFLDPETIIERTGNPFAALYRGSLRTANMTLKNIISIGKMFSGSVSVKALGGPIMIGMKAGETLARGLIAFLSMMAVLSIGLGIMNLLPIPVLDGGHIVLLGIEAVLRKPLSMRQIQIVQQIGMIFILLLTVVVMKNDIARLPFFNR